MNTQQFRVVTTNGQVSIGKKFAGKLVAVNENDNGEVIIKPGEFVPDNEKWLYQGDNLERLDKALAWAEKNPPQDNFAEFLAEMKIKNDEDTN